MANEKKTTAIHHSKSDERYPKTCLEQSPPVVLKYPPPGKSNPQPSRSHHSLRFRTQSVTLTEISELDEENHNQQQQLTSTENIRRIERKKIPLKIFLETTQEELCEIDGN
jgi:hypothetical protein